MWRCVYRLMKSMMTFDFYFSFKNPVAARRIQYIVVGATEAKSQYPVPGDRNDALIVAIIIRGLYSNAGGYKEVVCPVETHRAGPAVIGVVRDMQPV